MMRPTHPGECWNVAGYGTEEVYLVRINPDGTAAVCGHGVKTFWAKRPKQVPMANLFVDRKEARAEFRRRRLAQRGGA
jgi:hypothetical protein